MELLLEQTVSCPYCGELIEVLIDGQDADQQYIEDCQVCCQPITFRVRDGGGGELAVSVHSEDEAI